VVVWLILLARSYLNRTRWDPLAFKPKVDLGITAGVKSIQGSRAHMEDMYQAAINLDGDPRKAFFAVYDGHGGARASEFTAQHLHSHILKHDFTEQPLVALKKAFAQLDSDWLNIANHHGFDDGTTVIAVLIVNGTLYVANLGDSRAVLASSGKMIEMSHDHKPHRDDEKQRIESLGGRIIHYGTWRVEGVLAVTRAIGDRRLKKYVTSVPEIKQRQLQEGDDFLILATDGVWDVISSQNAVDIVSGSKSVQEAAAQLTDLAYRKGSMDNITSLVIDLRYYRQPS